jgi:hypothetical protein
MSEINRLEILANSCIKHNCSFSGFESNAIIEAMLEYHKSEVEKLPLASINNRRELLIAVFKQVKGVTIPETDEQIEYLVDKYSNL